MPRDWNLDTPEAQQLLQELTRNLQVEDEADNPNPEWQLTALDRTGTALYSASPSLSRDDSQAAPPSEEPKLQVEQILLPVCRIAHL